jgi:hypothetical protein
LIKELTTPNLEALDKIVEDWVETTKETPYAHKEAVFVQEMVKLLKATHLPEATSKATVEASKAPWWAFWRKK